MKYTGLLGKNIGYTMSPKIHNDFYRCNDLDIEYKIFDLDEEELLTFVEKLRIYNVIGFNITIPYKIKIRDYLSKTVYPADVIGAVNTVAVTEDGLVGYNTDYAGFIESLKKNQIEVQGKNALIIGNGGSARCVITALRDLKVKEVHIASRSKERAQKLVPGADGYHCTEFPIDLGCYDMIINCTPMGGANYREMIPVRLTSIKQGAVVYDLNYVPQKSLLLQEAEKLGAKIINGEEMLLCQALSAIDIWLRHSTERGK